MKLINSENLGDFVLKYRWPIIVVSVLVAFLFATGGRFLGFTTDYRYFFSKENPQLQAFEELQNTYTKNDNVLIGISPQNGNVFNGDTLAIVEELTLDSWQVPYSIRVDSLSNFQHTRAEVDDLIVEDLIIDAKSLTDAELKAKREIAIKEPLLLNRMIREKSNVTAVNVTINLPGKNPEEVFEVANFVRDMVTSYEEKYPDHKFYLTGMVMMNNAFASASKEDMANLVPIMFLVICIVMAVLIRSVAGTIATILVIFMSAASAMGFAGWTGILLSGPSSVAPTIILTLAVADSVHILVNMFHEMAGGKSKEDAIRESLRINLQPVFLTSFTTMIGFISLNFSEVTPYKDLGNIVTVGVFFAFLYSIFFLPALVSLLPVKHVEGNVEHQKAMGTLSKFVVTNSNKLFYIMLVFILFLFYGNTKIELNDKFVDYFDERYAFKRDTNYIVDNLTGIYNIDFSLKSKGESGISDPLYLSYVDEFAAWFRKHPHVIHVNSITDTFKRLNKNMHGDDENYYRLPDEKNLAAQYLLLYEMSLPFGLDLNNQINIDKSATRFSVTLENLDVKEVLKIERRSTQWLKDNAPEYMLAIGASPTLMFSHIAKRNIVSMLKGMALALLAIAIILMVSLKSVKIGLISLIPSFVPAFMAFGLWGFFVGQVGMALSVVAAISLGIVVDDTVHFLSKYVRAKREQKVSTVDAIHYSFKTVGTALVVTSVVLVCGFLVLTYSGFALNSDMGLLTAVSIAFALLADFLFLPPLLMKLDEGIFKEEEDEEDE